MGADADFGQIAARFLEAADRQMPLGIVRTIYDLVGFAAIDGDEETPDPAAARAELEQTQASIRGFHRTCTQGRWAGIAVDGATQTQRGHPRVWHARGAMAYEQPAARPAFAAGCHFGPA